MFHIYKETVQIPVKHSKSFLFSKLQQKLTNVFPSSFQSGNWRQNRSNLLSRRWRKNTASTTAYDNCFLTMGYVYTGLLILKRSSYKMKGIFPVVRKLNVINAMNISSWFRGVSVTQLRTLHCAGSLHYKVLTYLTLAMLKKYTVLFTSHNICYPRNQQTPSKVNNTNIPNT